MEEAFQRVGEGMVAGGGDVDALWTGTNVRIHGMLTFVENAHMFDATACCRSLNMHTCWIVVHMLNYLYMFTWHGFLECVHIIPHVYQDSETIFYSDNIFSENIFCNSLDRKTERNGTALPEYWIHSSNIICEETHITCKIHSNSMTFNESQCFDYLLWWLMKQWVAK